MPCAISPIKTLLPPSRAPATFSADSGLTTCPVERIKSRKTKIRRRGMIIKFSQWTILPAALLLTGTVALAQDTSTPNTTTTPSSTPAPQPAVRQRKENQQDRIANGVKSGQL